MPSRDDSQKETIRTNEKLDNKVRRNADETDIEYFFTDTLKTNPFGHNVSGENLYRRAERVAAAVHLLTSHMAKEEPIRSIVRNESVTLLDTTMLLRNELRVSGSEVFKRTQAVIRKLISLIRLLGVSGFASPQNTQIVSGALDELGNLLVTSQRSSLAEHVPLSREDLIPHGGEMTSSSRPLPESPPHSSNRRRRSGGGRGDVKSPSPEALGARALQVLDMLRSGGTLGIKDVALNLPEYSEKMIQRELAALVAAGKVAKSGAKRWSRYSAL